MTDRIDASPEPAPVDPAPLNGPQIANLDWSVGIVANTIAGPVRLLMTTEQADELRDRLVWLTGDGDA